MSMRTVLDLPRHLTVPADVAIEPLSLVPIPQDEAAWRLAHLDTAVPPGARLVVRGERASVSAHGWPMTITFGELCIDDRIVETRLCASYRFLDLLGGVVVRAPGPDGATPRQLLVDLVSQATPDLRGASLCLAELLPPDDKNGS